MANIENISYKKTVKILAQLKTSISIIEELSVNLMSVKTIKKIAFHFM